ncbi:hypothetical protein ACFWZ2_04250 [Streptomyces sp. NPDC059002]|uniref:hypothetical protein n=1 Tax=Streptomyces sp. NPDC059002 TaxID=3346690 RepID=UPI0036A5FC13
MTVDPSDPDTFDVEDTAAAADTDVETPEADSVEQHADLTPEHDDSLRDADPNAANEADLAEQARVVSIDEDDYR